MTLFPADTGASGKPFGRSGDIFARGAGSFWILIMVSAGEAPVNGRLLVAFS
jgi:hypothetical protein